MDGIAVLCPDSKERIIGAARWFYRELDRYVKVDPYRQNSFPPSQRAGW